jgi:hypothetical protein
MVKKSKTAELTETSKSPKVSKTEYTFKDASQLPRSKPDYVVQSPTPLGNRPVPQIKQDQ